MNVPIFDDFQVRRARRRLSERRATEETIDDVLQTAYSFRGSGKYRKIEPNQHSEELREMVERVATIDPENIMEIGSDLGGTLYVFSRCFPSLFRAISLDVSYPGRRAEFFRSFHDGVVTIEADSHDPQTVHQVEEALDGEPLDFLFIDGDHSYEGVKQDYEKYAPLVREGGIIAFHDIVEKPEDAWYNDDVHKFWTELRSEEETEEIVHHEPARYRVEDGDQQERIEQYQGIGLIL